MANRAQRRTQESSLASRPEPYREHFGRALAETRKAAGDTYADAATKLSKAMPSRWSISDRTLIEVEAGRAPVELRLVAAAASVYPGSLPQFLQPLLPAEWSNEDLTQRLLDAMAEGPAQEVIRGLTRQESTAFRMNVAQLPIEEVRVLNQWVLARLNYLSPAKERLAELLAEAIEDGFSRREGYGPTPRSR